MVINKILSDHSGHFLILGMGRTGVSCQKWLEKNNYKCLTWDDSSNDQPNINWKEVSCIIQSPGIPFLKPKPHQITLMARENNVPIVSDLNLFQAIYANKCIGITGTNGKSTVTALLGEVLEEVVGKSFVAGNIGRAVMDLPEGFDEEVPCVFELSSYQLEISEPIELDVAVFLNLSADHLERHGTIEDYFNAKMRIFKKAKQAIIGIDDIWGKRAVEKLLTEKTPVISISSVDKRADVYIDAQGQVFIKQQLSRKIETCYAVRGEHNRQNTAAVIGSCFAMGINLNLIIDHIQTFKGLDHRQNIVRILNNVTFINDSKATNALATSQAIKSFKGEDIYLIIGGLAKVGGLEEIKDELNKVKKVFLIGESQDQFSETFAAINVPFKKCTYLKLAVTLANKEAGSNIKNNTVVLFSPACASFDQFKNFEDRGLAFTNYVKEL